jgi:ribosome-associated toxin RatA of RatAB toxin-antitoxin module
MREVRRNAIVPYSAGEMYAIVNDVAAYPAFVPWCPSVEIFESSATMMRARLDIARAGLATSITTVNRLAPCTSIELEQVEGPLESFRGTWRFTPIERAGRAPGCKVELEVSYAFRSSALAILFGPMFAASWDSLVDAFVRRAHQLNANTRA